MANQRGPTGGSRDTQGTGLFLGSGQVIAIAGPVGALLAYLVMGMVTAGVSFTTGEITAFKTETGGFVRHATQFVEPALGAAAGWNFCECIMSLISAFGQGRT